MTQFFRRGATALAVALAATCLGCGGVPAPAPQSDPQLVVLSEVMEILRGASVSRPPAKLSDLAPLERLNPAGYQAVKDGSVVVLYGTAVAGEGDAGEGGPIVAYEKNAPTAGGYVVFASSEVRKLSADEFAAAPKAGKK